MRANGVRAPLFRSGLPHICPKCARDRRRNGPQKGTFRNCVHFRVHEHARAEGVLYRVILAVAARQQPWRSVCALLGLSREKSSPRWLELVGMRSEAFFVLVGTFGAVHCTSEQQTGSQLSTSKWLSITSWLQLWFHCSVLKSLSAHIGLVYVVVKEQLKRCSWQHVCNAPVSPHDMMCPN